jgi:hypothetical protein
LPGVQLEITGHFFGTARHIDGMNAELTPEEHVTPETPPPEFEEEIVEFDEVEAPSRNIDPAFMYIVLAIIGLFGLNNFAPEVRYTILWTATALIAILAIAIDKVTFEALSLRRIIIGFGLGALVALPILGVGAVQLSRISHDIFVGISNPSLFNMLIFTMPFVESLYYRGALHSARGAVFSGIASGIWWNILFLPQLRVQNVPMIIGLPLLAAVIGLCFILINFLYSYVRHRFGLYASWACQIVVNLLLLFVCRFV